jgi:hypothetical protein
MSSFSAMFQARGLDATSNWQACSEGTDPADGTEEFPESI